MALTVADALKSNKNGFHIGQRLILPFKCQIIKIIVDDEIYTELVGSDNVKINQDPNNTSVFFRIHGKLTKMVGTYQVVKMIVAEMTDDLTDVNTHRKIVCEMEEHHNVNIHEPNDDMLFIE